MKNEMYILCRKPLQEKTIADNVLKWGTGGINIDVSRIGSDDVLGRINKSNQIDTETEYKLGLKAISTNFDVEGRFPANLIHDGSDEVMKEFDKAGNRKSVKGKLRYAKVKGSFGGGSSACEYTDEGSAARYFWKTTD